MFVLIIIVHHLHVFFFCFLFLYSFIYLFIFFDCFFPVFFLHMVLISIKFASWKNLLQYKTFNYKRIEPRKLADKQARRQELYLIMGLERKTELLWLDSEETKLILKIVSCSTTLCLRSKLAYLSWKGRIKLNMKMQDAQCFKKVL